MWWLLASPHTCAKECRAEAPRGLRWGDFGQGQVQGSGSMAGLDGEGVLEALDEIMALHSSDNPQEGKVINAEGQGNTYRGLC